MPHFLLEVSLNGLRAIDDLQVSFEYPVSVIAGGNATGKSTVLFAAACAYRVPNSGVRDFVPSTLFPDFRPKSGVRYDERSKVNLDYHYATPTGRQSMRWQRIKGWNRSYFGRKNAIQPERPVYLRTLSNLSNPSEVRGVLSMSRMKGIPEESPLTPLQIEFAQRMLPFQYSDVVDLTNGSKSLMFAAQKGGASYSELHMAAGERALLRLAKEIANLEGALVLIDEVEAGLHPFVQQLLMLQLQELALRRNLQIIVTSHSPVVLDSVHPLGRIFLEREPGGSVAVRSAYKDVIQNALYGQSSHQLNILCEDNIAEAILRGIFDVLIPRLRIRMETIKIGRNTGAGEFPTHAKAFKSFGMVENFVFVLDGDQQKDIMTSKIREAANYNVPVLFLPGSEGPETWIWSKLRTHTDTISEELHLNTDDLATQIANIDQIFSEASDSPANIAKTKLRTLCDAIKINLPTICQRVAYDEIQHSDSDIQILVSDLENTLLQWREDSY
ncbi:MAG: AAA family ATPase [Bacteroidetes bacterium]|nr:AAA family ATPase [Bacteroidota bacterium]